MFTAEQVADTIQEVLKVAQIVKPQDRKVVHIHEVDFMEFFVCYKIFDFFKTKRIIMPNEKFNIDVERVYPNMIFYGQTIWSDNVTFVIHSERAKTVSQKMPVTEPYNNN